MEQALIVLRSLGSQCVRKKNQERQLARNQKLVTAVRWRSAQLITSAPSHRSAPPTLTVTPLLASLSARNSSQEAPRSARQGQLAQLIVRQTCSVMLTMSVTVWRKKRRKVMGNYLQTEFEILVLFQNVKPLETALIQKRSARRYLRMGKGPVKN